MKEILQLLLSASIAAVTGALVFFLAAEGLAEGAVAGALLGGSLGIITAMRRASGSTGPAFEYEAAGIHDGNLITIARRNLVRDAHRDTFGKALIDDKIERMGDADLAKRKRRYSP